MVSHRKPVSLALSPVDQSQPLTPGLICSSTGNSRVVSPGRAGSCSPISPSQSSSIEGFDWPDVQELRSKYSDHSRSQRTLVSRGHSLPERIYDGGLRRHSSCSSSFLPDGMSEEVSSSKPCSSRDAGREERKTRLHRANSLDPRLSGAQMTELQKLQDRAADVNYDGYYVAAETPLPNDPEHKVIIMEKLPEPESEPAGSNEDDEDNYVQIRSPTSREKISILAVIDRCRVYQESDEYKQREEVKTRTEPVRSNEPDTAAASSNDLDGESQKMSGQKTKTGQQSIVKNLREKFQSLS